MIKLRVKIGRLRSVVIITIVSVVASMVVTGVMALYQAKRDGLNRTAKFSETSEKMVAG